MALGDVLAAYSDQVGTITGYRENKYQPDPSYPPESSADKTYWLDSGRKDNSGYDSGNFEEARQGITIHLLFRMARNVAWSDALQAAWNNLDTVEKSLLAFAATRADYLNISSITLDKLAEDWREAVITGTVGYQRSLA